MISYIMHLFTFILNNMYSLKLENQFLLILA